MAVASFRGCGPWSDVVDIPEGDYLRLIFESLVASARAQDFLDSEDETLSNVEADVGDLVGADDRVEGEGGGKSPPPATFVFGRSVISQADLKNYAKQGWFKIGQVRCPGGETVPRPHPDEAVVFRDFYTCGLRLPCLKFVRLVLEGFGLQLHHLTPNAVCALSKFAWACYSFGASPDADCFFDHYELQNQLKKVKVDGERRNAQFGSCTFIAKKRSKGQDSPQISYAQKGRWPNHWPRYWFYAKVPVMTFHRNDGTDIDIHPLASTMSVMKTVSCVSPKNTESRRACEKAFEFACRFSSGRDLVEEFLAAGVWPLGQNCWKKYKLKEMSLPLYGLGVDEPVPFPRFGLEKPRGKSDEEVVAEVETKAKEILGAMSDREYASRVVVAGTTPCLNQIFEELGVWYEKRVPPLKVQAALAPNAKVSRVATESTMKAEALKRKNTPAGVRATKKAKVGSEKDFSEADCDSSLPADGPIVGTEGKSIAGDRDMGGCGVVSPCVMVVGDAPASLATDELAEDALPNLPLLFGDELESSFIEEVMGSGVKENAQGPNPVDEEVDIDSGGMVGRACSASVDLRVENIERSSSTKGSRRSTSSSGTSSTSGGGSSDSSEHSGNGAEAAGMQGDAEEAQVAAVQELSGAARPATPGPVLALETLPTPYAGPSTFIPSPPADGKFY